MLKLNIIFIDYLKGLLFIAVLLEIVVIYCAITVEYTDLIIGCIDYKLIGWGYYFSVEEPFKIIFRWFIPLAVVLSFVKIKYSKRERIIKVFKNLYSKFTALQLILFFCILTTFWFYLHKFYILLYRKYKHCSL